MISTEFNTKDSGEKLETATQDTAIRIEDLTQWYLENNNKTPKKQQTTTNPITTIEEWQFNYWTYTVCKNAASMHTTYTLKCTVQINFYEQSMIAQVLFYNLK